jgi:hypothetical protein
MGPNGSREILSYVLSGRGGYESAKGPPRGGAELDMEAEGAPLLVCSWLPVPVEIQVLATRRSCAPR